MPSIRLRLLVILLAVFTVVWAGVVAITYVNVRGQVEERFDAQLGQTAQVLWLLYSSARAGGPPPEDPYADRVIARFGISYAFQVWDGHELLARSANAPGERMAQGYGPSGGMLQGEPWRFYYRVDALHGLDVIVGNKLADRQSLVATLVLGMVWPLLAGLPLLAVLIVLGVQQALRPIGAVIRMLGSRHAEALEAIPDQGVPREIVPLTQALTDLLERLKNALESERRFTASASHELRTPLAALKAQAQLALKAESEADRRHTLNNVIASVDRATHLLEQLLTLARLDPDTHQQNAERVDLSTLAQEAIVELDAAARRKHIDIELHAEPAWVEGRPTALAVLLRNLVDNAIRYSPVGGTVDVTVKKHGDSASLCVMDRGPGIPAEDRERVFHRFYRRLGTAAEGTGLGLSIVARVADVHGAQVTLESAEPATGNGDPGLRVIVRFPPLSGS